MVNRKTINFSTDILFYLVECKLIVINIEHDVKGNVLY